jgi:hypothetical protein
MPEPGAGDVVERALVGMAAERRMVLEQPLRDGWAPVVGINLYEVPDDQWQHHVELVRRLGPSPAAWLESGARIQLLAAWRGQGVRHVLWVNWFPAADVFLGPPPTPDEQAVLDEWLSVIRHRTWHVGEDFTHPVENTPAGPSPARPESGADSRGE